MSDGRGRIHIGIGGWTFPPWRGVFYPKGLPHKAELAYAAQHLTGIEVNGTFYRLQSPETFAHWHDEAPDGFVFALKGSRFITNRRVPAEAGPAPVMPRDVFLFVISGAKQRNPAAAMALISRP